MSAVATPPFQQAQPREEDTGVHPRRWTREDYHKAAEAGLFAPEERLELIRGEIYRKMPQGPSHIMGVRACLEAATTAFGPGYDVRPQMPIALAEDGEPEPDILVVPGSWRDYPTLPTKSHARLLIEVSDTTLRYDQMEKASLYAQAGIADYWILNLPGRVLEIRRDPIAIPDVPGLFGYRSLTLYYENDTVSPLAVPQAIIRVGDLLPPSQADVTT